MRRVEAVRGEPVTIALDDAVREGDRVRSIVRARVIDELTGEPVRVDISVDPSADLAGPSVRRALSPRATAEGGIVGMVGVPTQALPALASHTYRIGVAVRAPGFLPAESVAAFGPLAPGVDFPDEFTPLHLPDIALHRAPVVLRGRAEERQPDGSVLPAPLVTVDVTQLWRRVPDAAGAPAPIAAEALALHPPLYATRPVATTQSRTVTLTAVGTDKQLAANARAGERSIRITDRMALAAGDLLEIDTGDAERTEWLQIMAIDGAADPQNVATVTFEFPLARDHAAGVTVRETSVAVVAALPALFAAGVPGDMTLLFDPGAGIASSAHIQMDDGGAVHEYHRADPYTATTDGDGFYRLPPLSRVAQLTLRSVLGPRVLARTVAVAYPAAEQAVDFLFT